MRAVLLFTAKLLVLSGPLYVTLLLADLSPLQLLVASHAEMALHALGLAPFREGAALSVSSFHFFISPDSTGWKAFLLFGALVLAVPAVTWKRRAIALTAGTGVLYLANVGRVTGIVLIEQWWGREAALLAHDYLWSAGMVALVLALWLGWYARGRGE